MRVVIYIRVSTDEQAIDGYSIRGQKTQLIEYCRLHGYEIVYIYIDDGYSAKNTKRPQLQQLLEDAKAGKFDAILVYKLDRFSRSVRDLYELLEQLKIYSVGFMSKQEKFDTTTAIGKLFFGFLAILAEFERDLISERVRMGQEQKVREGKRPGAKHPLGYDKNGVQIPEEVEDLRLVRDLYMNGLSYQAVAVQMQGKLRRGYEWTATNVALTLENPFYAGIIRYGSKLANGKYAYRKREEKVKVLDVIGTHEPIWTVEEYESHLARMRRRSTGGYSHTLTYAFNGLLKCGRCGAAMYGRLTTARSRKNNEIVRTAYYWCARRKANKGCDMPMFRQSHVEHLVMGHIEQIRMDQGNVKQLQESIDRKVNDQGKDIAKLKRDLDKIKARVKKWQYAFAEDLISADDLRMRMSEEALAEEAIMMKLDQYTGIDKQVDSDSLFDLVELWPSLNDIDKQDVLGTVFEQIKLMTDETNVKGVKNAFFPATIEVRMK